MSHRRKGDHKPRHHTHAVKPNFASVLKPIRTAVVEETPAPTVKATANKAVNTAIAEPATA